MPSAASMSCSQAAAGSLAFSAALIAAMSIFFIVIMASKARFAAVASELVTAFVRASGVICQNRPHLSLHQPHSLSWPPWPMIAFQYLSAKYGKEGTHPH